MQRFHIQDLRSMSAVAMDINIQDLLRRPLAQIDPRTLADLFALAVAEGVPKGTQKGIVAFTERMINEIADLPVGDGFQGFINELLAIDAGQIPQGLRDAVATEASNEERPVPDCEKASAAVAAWADVPPDAVAVKAEPAPEEVRVQKVSAAPSRGSTTSKRRPAAKRRPKPVVDEARVEFIQEAVFDRLSGYSDSGLLQAVLVAGVMHQAKQAGYSDIAPYEVLAVLRKLKDQQRVRHSAGRWSRSLRGW